MSQECDMAQMSALTEEHQRFEPFAGTFRAEVKMWMGPGEPHVSTGVMTNTLDLGGRFLAQSYKGDQTDGSFPNFEGRGYWGFNTVTNKYEGIWMDTASTFMQPETGNVDPTGKIWTMRSRLTDPRSGGPLHKRSVITLIDNDHHSMELYFQGPDGNEFKSMEIRYERV